MKRILVATDYSETAQNAVQYAAALAQASLSGLVLYHAFPYVAVTDIPPDIMERIARDTREEHLEKLESIQYELQKKYGIDVVCAAEPGGVMRHLPDLIQAHNVWLAVMGNRGTNPVRSLLIGSAVTEAMRSRSIPLLVVPKGAQYTPPRRILFACDLLDNISGATLAPLKTIAETFDCDIEVYSVDDHKGQSDRRQNNLESHFRNVKHHYVFELSGAFRDQILEMARESAADMLAMIPHKHPFWAYLFDKSNTLYVAMHTDRPMLVMAEKSA